jgi:hypothetical protein
VRADELSTQMDKFARIKHGGFWNKMFFTVVNLKRIWNQYKIRWRKHKLDLKMI